MKNILEWLEISVKDNETKPIYSDLETQITFGETYLNAKRIGSGLDRLLTSEAPVAVFMDRCVYTPVGYFGVLYSGRAYAPIDAKLPKKRIEKILEGLQPEKVLTQMHLAEVVAEYVPKDRICFYEDLVESELDEDRLLTIRRKKNGQNVSLLLYR